MGRHRKSYDSPYRPPPPTYRRICHITASGVVHGAYVGMCGARSGFDEKVRMYESCRIWSRDTVAEFIARFVTMAREKSIWPDFVPLQEPIFEVLDCLQEVKAD